MLTIYIDARYLIQRERNKQTKDASQQGRQDAVAKVLCGELREGSTIQALRDAAS